jgi:hypothetical protein
VQSILLFHLRETEAWAGELQPALTADRVSALRWHVRAARQLLNTMAPHLDVTDLGEIPRGLRWLAKTSRPLQQSQATVQHLEEYVSSVGEAPSGVLTMLQQWQADRERAQVEVSRALNSRQYRRFVRTVQAFGRKQGAGIFGKSVARQPVRYVLPGLIWGQYQDLRLLEGGIATADARFVRSMRRQVRDLNHNLVGFQAVLGTPGRECSRTAYSAEEQLRWFDGLESAIESARLFLGAAQSGGAAAEGVETFIGAKEAEQARWLEDLSLIWDPVASPQFRTELGLAVAEL